MSRLPFLQTGALPALSEDAGAATSSPARGQEMRSNLLQKLRAPALVHSWSFWHDRQDRRKPAGATADAEDRYEDRLVMLHEIEDVKQFWSVYNNFELHNLQLKDSIHLFHRGTKPVWEDPRNVKGGAWTFRVPKEKAGEFWQQVSLLAVGEQLQAAVKDPKRVRFHDDICGVSYSVRFTSVLISVWNRDAENAAGIQKIKEVIFEALDQELVPKEGVYYYKKHSQHPGFRAPEGDASAAA
ncbi:translation initiation factor eIF4e [Patellaria atrata CBS 101060]|uniref:Translation initiation factor eIF4e n=1 Tax=Patellaria atrata CBS 101060 TaxID=1346257 RepID=A0A9P4S8N6_9PEZI|nr:translation initiation factor eIF4e [Patellaria atrata CBS 101060]